MNVRPIGYSLPVCNTGQKRAALRAGDAVAFRGGVNVSPADVMDTILKYEDFNHGSRAALRMVDVIDNIAGELESPQNQNILLVGHCKPDGDTIGSVLAMKAALALKFPDKNVVCAIDDKIPGLFRNKLPGINDNMKNADQIQGQNFDLVVMMDIPTPKRFTGRFKDQIESADKVIYIDHHTYRPQEWDAAKGLTGVDMGKIHESNLDLVAELVPAATELVAVVSSKILPEILGSGTLKTTDLTSEQRQHIDEFVAGTVTGMATDTGGFKRRANLMPEHMSLPEKDRPDFKPELLAGWLMQLTPKITRDWLRDVISYNIPDIKSEGLNRSARDIMVAASLDGAFVREDLGLGIVSVDYDKIKEILDIAKESDPETTILDVQNSFKYSDVLNMLRDPGCCNQSMESVYYKSHHDNSRITALICQDKKAGEPDDRSDAATQDNLRLSFRSRSGTIWAELLANLFGGGGHGCAAGATFNLPEIDSNTKLAVKINGEIENCPSVILQTLKQNREINNKNLPNATPIEVVKSDTGKTVSEIIQSLTAAIRRDEYSAQK